MILVRGKGGKERLVPLSGPAREALAATGWCLRDAPRRQGAPKGPSRHLFPSRGAARAPDAAAVFVAGQGTGAGGRASTPPR
jgi:site-specific recombinase XerD